MPALSAHQHWLLPQQIFDLSSQILPKQTLQQQTGGAHFAALFDRQGSLLAIAEDIGRHNALDKLVGKIKLELPLADIKESMIVISSRVSFEMVQKTLIAGVAVLVALGAPSSLAIKAAKRFNLTLIAFAKPTQFNVYHDPNRLKQRG